MNKNLESIIQSHAEMMADKMVRAAKLAKSEEDVRIECTKLIDGFVKKAGLKIKGRHEYGLAGGRIDSKYGGVIIEYKDPKGSGKITENKNAPGVKAVVKQIKKRFKDFQTEEQIGPERIFGVGCDGDTFVFVRLRGKTIEAEPPQPVTKYSVERLLRAIVSVGAKGLSFTPDNLCDRFGDQGQVALDGIERIYAVISTTTSPKALIFFKQWQILFGEVCGYDVHGQSDRIRKLGEHYNIPTAKPAELLFSVHTYYGILIKLLAAEIVSSFSPLGTSTLKRLESAPTSAKLRAELESLEQGGIWSKLGIRNFLEGDLFSWYLDAWDERLESAIRKMVTTLNKFDPTTLSVEPSESRDLLKKLYQHLFPKSVRHDLGEYYTPDWLAELTLDELGYDGDPDKRILDPACGSGTFLVMAINRIKVWYSEHRLECGFGEDELLKKILNNVIGFDLNPLAVMAARTNYLLAIRDLFPHSAGIELPVYLCDSIMIPKDYSRKGGATFDYLPLKTAVQTFHIPMGVLRSRTLFAKYSDILHDCVENDYSETDFLSRLADEGIEAKQESQHRTLFSALTQLKKQDQNGIWARIIKNAFAPLFISKVDYVAGNPPWVNWENLPEEYRDSMKPLWAEYGLFTLSGSAARLGGGKKDLSMLFVYTAVDNYLNEKGRLGFVITQSVFKTQGAGDGFRRLRYTLPGTKTTWYLKPVIVHDLSALQVFDGATNRTAVFVCEKTKRSFNYPVKYETWSGPSRISQDKSLQDVLAATARSKMGALPVVADKDSSPWLTAPKQALSGIQKVLGQSDFNAYAGCCTWLNSVYWINILKRLPNGELLIENLHDVGKIKVEHVQAVIEADLVYPLLRGRDVHRWQAEPSAHIILAQDPQTRKGIPESEMKRNCPKTFAYLKKFEGEPKKPMRGTLRGRSGYRQYFKPTDPFYSMYNVGPYTMAKWKVVWREQSSIFQAALSGPVSTHVVLPDHKLMLIPCSSQHEAHFLIGMLNSGPSLLTIYSYAISTSISTHVIENVRVPKFKKKEAEHIRLSEFSLQCHAAAKKNDEEKIAELESEIDEIAARIWGITPAELKAIQKAIGKD